LNKVLLNKVHEVNTYTGKVMRVQFFWNIILCCCDTFFLLCNLMCCPSRLHVAHSNGAGKLPSLSNQFFSCIIHPAVVH